LRARGEVSGRSGEAVVVVVVGFVEGFCWGFVGVVVVGFLVVVVVMVVVVDDSGLML
jgi:hypothetical protein